MKRRTFISLLGGAVAAWPLAARAQQPAMPVIGVLTPTSFDNNADRLRAFRSGLAEHGYVEGQNVAIDFRSAEAGSIGCRPWRPISCAGRSRVIAVPGSAPAALAAKEATTTIPIAFGVPEDPVKLGLVASLPRPGGNATGINFFIVEVDAKRLNLLHEWCPLPRASPCWSIRPMSGASSPRAPNSSRPRACSDCSSNSIMPAPIRRSIPPTRRCARAAGRALRRRRRLFASRRVQLISLAARHALPAVYAAREFVEGGGLMSYGTSITDMYRQVGVYCGRILKGEKPADLPVVQASKFELIINHQTARRCSGSPCRRRSSPPLTK